ncbi:hypothetical protein F4808DRAFT_452115 [Astrocystis sublimbata]|nr:hypothetical protein F4808DRAFT_452115 [Astrocystis sublimbata]
MAASRSNMATDTTVLRKLGINETYQLAMYLLDQYRGTILSCSYAIPPRLAESRPQLEAAVKLALVDTILRHPMLQVAMIDSTAKTPSWIQLPSLDLNQHVEWLYLEPHADFEQKVQDTFRLQLDQEFPDLSRPGWKITLIRSGDAPIMEVILTWNHPYFDGTGARILHEDFLGMLNHAYENETSERPGLEGDIFFLPQTPPPMLPIPIELLTHLPVDFKHLLRALWEENRPQFLNWDVSYATWCPIRPIPYKTQYRTFDLNKPTLDTILALCRKNKTTFTALLNGLLLIAFSLRLDSTAAPAFQSSTIIDHRRNLPPAPQDAPWGSSDRVVSNYVTQLLHKFDVAQVAHIRSKLPPADATGEGRALSTGMIQELWAVAAENRLEILAKLEDPLRNDIVGLFKYVTDWKGTMSGMAKKPRQFTWLVTNVGVLDGGGGRNIISGHSKAQPGTNTNEDVGQAGEWWSIRRAQFGLSSEVPAAAIEFAPVSVAGQGMCVSANWHDCALDVGFGEGIMADLERWLLQLAEQS